MVKSNLVVSPVGIGKCLYQHLRFLTRAGAARIASLADEMADLLQGQA